MLKLNCAFVLKSTHHRDRTSYYESHHFSIIMTKKKHTISQLITLVKYFPILYFFRNNWSSHNSYLLTGTGLPHHRDENPEENVAAEHEDQADCFGDSNSIDPRYSPLCLPWVQLLIMSSFLQEAFYPVYLNSRSYTTQISYIYIYHDFSCSLILATYRIQILGTKSSRCPDIALP